MRFRIRILTACLILSFLLSNHPTSAARKRSKNIKKNKYNKNKHNSRYAAAKTRKVHSTDDYDMGLDSSKDDLVKRIIKEEFKGEIVKVVGRDQYHGRVKNTLIHGQSNNLVHVDTLQHGENYIFWG